MSLSYFLLYCKALSLKCEKIENFGPYVWGVGNQKTCFMKTASINTAGISISVSRDITIEAIIFDSNKKIIFLPENPAQSFPKLLIFYASGCDICSISKSNFKHLDKLQELFLHSNKLTKIDSNTFEDLRSLIHIELGENEIYNIEACLTR